MSKTTHILTDQFGRNHNYLRISLTEKCNLRCSYCMPPEGINLSPQAHLMTANEIYEIAKIFVENGVDKIRLTGGEPLVRKDFLDILKKLSTLNISLGITTNGVLIDQFIEAFKTYHLKHINISLDSLKKEKFEFITRRDKFHKTYENILLLIENNFHVKINTVLMKGFNEDEILDFIELTKEWPITVRFIEFMPFDGNNWNKEKLVTQEEILKIITAKYKNKLIKSKNSENYISRDYQINGYKGKFGIISSVSNPFCDVCNRIRLTADGKIKNCLFSNVETNLLSKFRAGKNLEEIIQHSIYRKKAIRGGMDNFDKLKDPQKHSNNRSMTTIGG